MRTRMVPFDSLVPNLRRTLRPLMVVLALGALLSLVQGDLGGAIVLCAIVFAVAFLGGTPMTPMLFMTVAGAAGMSMFVFTSQRRMNRFTAFLDIAANKDYLSFQVYQAMIGMGTGGVSGTGVGRGPSKWGYLPLAHSDFIFAVIGEELGLIGVVAVIGCFLLLTYGGVQVALAARDRFGTLLAGGIVAWLAVQAVINIGGVSGAMPVTGLTLPFFLVYLNRARGIDMFVAGLALSTVALAGFIGNPIGGWLIDRVREVETESRAATAADVHALRLEMVALREQLRPPG